MRLLEPDGTPAEGTPEPGAGKPVWQLSRDKLALIEVEGSAPVAVETPDAEVVLAPGGDYLIVARELYLRMATDLRVFRDWEKRTLASLARRDQRHRDREGRR